MLPIRQGDVILKVVNRIEGRRLSHLTLAEGEVTGHSHRIADGKAELYEKDGTLYLKVLSETATLIHEEHKAIDIPQEQGYDTRLLRRAREILEHPERYRSHF